MKYLSAFLLWGLVVFLTCGCRREKPETAATEDESGPVWFEEVTDEKGIHFVHDVGGSKDEYFMPHLFGSGAAWFDFDGDGLIDLYLLNNGGPKGQKNVLYKQLPDGTFTDVSAGSGLDIAGFNMGVAVGDINNDGRPDVVVSQYGGVKLFLNNGNGTFSDITVQAGIDNALWATSVSFLDFDRDGKLDLFITNYLAYDPSVPCTSAHGFRDFCNPKTHKPTTSRLYRNLGPGVVQQKGAALSVPVRFQDVSFESGIGRTAGPGLGVVCADFNGDGWPDIFVANDSASNHLWINQKNGTFVEEAGFRGVAMNAMGVAEANMGIGWGDIDGDGLQDLFVTHLASETNSVWRQVKPGLFHDTTVSTAMHQPRWRATGFGTILGDFDNDGALDVAIANGAVVRTSTRDARLGPFWGRYGQRNQLFANDGKGRFRDISSSNKALCGSNNVGRGMAMADVRNNGELWLVITSIADKARLFRSTAARQGNWLGLRLFDPRLKRDALGSDIVVRAGPRQWVCTAHTGGSYLCSNDPRVHIGLGEYKRVDSIEVTWPDGLRERFAGREANQHVELRRGSGRPIRP